ncbi:unnamed protein product, partial [Allacma fusca]
HNQPVNIVQRALYGTNTGEIGRRY